MSSGTDQLPLANSRIIEMQYHGLHRATHFTYSEFLHAASSIDHERPSKREYGGRQPTSVHSDPVQLRDLLKKVPKK
ncbi:unnamed protein product [Echinostoma caproni]|uniref:Uncharacterized protein n=1 Tax=Echinostoma caproni TaxID=27848 RepID=A0A183A548_9TREM|nr:unnamed protein product [Echinostoma caproni]